MIRRSETILVAYGGSVQRIVLELKRKRKQALESFILDGLEQTAKYMDRVGTVREGHFTHFDRTPGKSWDEKLWHRRKTFGGYEIMVWGMYPHT